MNKFRVGQRVRLTAPASVTHISSSMLGIGSLGTIKAEGFNSKKIVKFDNGLYSWNLKEEWLEPLFKAGQKVKVVPFGKEGTVVGWELFQGEYKVGVEVNKAKCIGITPVLKYYPEEILEAIPEEQPKIRHPHAELMLQYAQDALTMPIEEVNKNWEQLSPVGWVTLFSTKEDCLPAWYEDIQYRRKPKTIRIGNYDVPEPLREAPVEATTIYFVDLAMNTLVHDFVYYTNQHYLINLVLRRRIAHLTREAAELHAKALLSLAATE